MHKKTAFGVIITLSALVLLIEVFLFGNSIGFTSSETSESIITITPVNELKITSQNTQWFRFQDQIYTATIIDGSIVIFSENDTGWYQYQRLTEGSADFTTFQVADVNNDGFPEIIAGTLDPGFIFLYKMNNENLWVLNTGSKHVWSAVINIAIGNFSGISETEMVVQTDEGYLYYLKVSDRAIDLIWKSPTTWKQIDLLNRADLDGDGCDELVVIYKTGSVAVLKIINNSVTLSGEFFPWGKVISTAFGDLNQNGQVGFILTTTQKVTYFLTLSGKNYRLNQNAMQFNYLVDNIYFLNSHQFITTDTSGRLHLLEYHKESKEKEKWKEVAVYQIGRINKIISWPNHDQIYLWGANYQVLTLTKQPDHL